MTRIISGSAKGRTLKVPGSARPTADRVRESLFTALEHRLGTWEGKRVLDLFSGSGALALEALSRGAVEAVCVEAHRQAAEVIRANARSVGLPARVELRDAFKFAAAAEPSRFDVVFADPPYEAVSDEDVVGLLESLVTRGWVGEGTWLVVERSSRRPQLPLPPGAVEEETRRYGDTSVVLACW